MYSKKSNIAIILGALLLWGLLGALLFSFLYTDKLIYCSDDDIVEMNRIAKEVALHADEFSKLDGARFAFAFSVLDEDGKLCYTHGDDTNAALADALRQGDTVLQIRAADGIYSLLIQGNSLMSVRAKLWRAGACLWLFAGLMISMFLFGTLYIKNQIIAPFQRMKGFASAVSAGNLDIPLEMGKKKYFGAYTESFDLMREELKRARELEYRANLSKKELVASLSHDIKTPVTSIKLMCELMREKLSRQALSSAEQEEKLKLIYAKAEQIDLLVSDMFQSSMEDLGELQVRLSTEESGLISEILRHTDFREKIKSHKEPPACLLSVDKLRLEQVIGNIVNNSYKYADTDIEVDYALKDGFLEMRIADFGAGVTDAEAPHIFQKFYRGKNALLDKQSGAGLGLYICRSLMEKMEGGISCEKTEDGFCIVLYIALAG